MVTKTKSNYLILAIAFVSLVIVGAVLFTVVPKLSVVSRAYQVEKASYKTLTCGQSVSVQFNAPCERINNIVIDIKGVDTYEEPLGMIDADLVLETQDGTTLYSRHIQSLYEEDFATGGLDTARQEPLTLTFTFNSADAGIDNIKIGVNADGDLAYTIKGINSGAPTKSLFLIIYVLFAVLVLVFAYYTTQTDPKVKALIEKMLFITGIIFAVIFINQLYDLFMTAKCGLNLINSIKQGRLLDYYNVAYLNELDKNSSSMFFGFNYNIFIALPAAVVMLPFSFFVDDIDYNMLGVFVTLYMKVIVAILVVWSVILTQKIGDACGMSKDYNRSVKLIYAFSPFMLYVSVGFGQIDIMYVILMLFALPFYYKGRYKMFSLVMAFAVVMKLIPFLVFVPLILLTNKKLKDIALNTLICLSVKLGTAVLFEKGTGYNAIMNLMADWHGFINKLFASSIGGLSLFVMAFAGVCIYCYLKDVDTSDKKTLLYHSMLIIFVVYAAFTAFVDWHPQWLIPLVMSFAFLLPMCQKKYQILLIFSMLELFMMLGGESKLNTVYMIQTGLLALGSGYYYDGVSISGILKNISPVTPTLLNSLVAVIAVAVAAYFIKTKSDKSSDYNVENGLSVGRILVLYAIYIGAFWCFSFVG